MKRRHAIQGFVDVLAAAEKAWEGIRQADVVVMPYVDPVQ